MHPRELERFEGVAAHSLMACGYGLALQGHARQIGPVERWSWRVHGRAVRLARRDAWRDTAYRVRLRATTAGRQLATAMGIETHRPLGSVAQGPEVLPKQPG
jgi:hypothetical protein